MLSDSLVIKRPQCLLLKALLLTKRTRSEGALSPLSERVIRVRESVSQKLRDIKKRDYNIPDSVFDNPIISDVSPKEWSYIAGFLDGDGRLALEDTALRFSFYNTNPKALLWIQKRIGGTVRKASRRKCHKLQPYQLYIPFKFSMQVLPKIIPYLVVKQEIARVCLEAKQNMVRENRAEWYTRYRAAYHNSPYLDCFQSSQLIYQGEEI
jgi:hypothetical protein